MLKVFIKTSYGFTYRYTYISNVCSLDEYINTTGVLFCRFRCDDMMVTVADYFASKYDIRLKYPQLPLVIERRPSGESYYPMEKLIVCENQRVTQTQQSSAQVQAMIKVRQAQALRCLYDYSREWARDSVLVREPSV